MAAQAGHPVPEPHLTAPYHRSCWPSWGHSLPLVTPPPFLGGCLHPGVTPPTRGGTCSDPARPSSQGSRGARMDVLGSPPTSLFVCAPSPHQIDSPDMSPCLGPSPPPPGRSCWWVAARPFLSPRAGHTPLKCPGHTASQLGRHLIETDLSSPALEAVSFPFLQEAEASLSLGTVRPRTKAQPPSEKQARPWLRIHYTLTSLSMHCERALCARCWGRKAGG